MMETTPISSAAPPGISPTDLTPGQEVDIESRTWAGINKPGGHATIDKIHYDDNGVANKVDVRYVLGGREVGVELTYLKVHVELARRSRSRVKDVKMNVDTFGGVAVVQEKKKKRGGKKLGGSVAKKKVSPSSPTKNKKRKALADIASSPTKNNNEGGNKKRKALAHIDGNHGKVKAAKKSKKVEEESSSNVADVVEPAEEVGGTDDGKWTLIQDGKITDYTDTLQKGQCISYWWSEEDGWLNGTISKSLTKAVTATTIRWTVKVDFDNGDTHVLAFHPTEKRWKVSNKKPSAVVIYSPKKLSPKKPASKKSTKPVGEKKDAKLKGFKIMGEKDMKGKAAIKNSTIQSSTARKSNTAQTKGVKQTKQQSTLSFGSNLQSKIKEISSKMHTAKTPSSSGDDDLVNLAVRAAHAKSHKTASHSTSSIVHSDGKKKLPQDMEVKMAAVSLISPPSSQSDAPGVAHAKGADRSKAVKSQGSMEYAKSLKASGKGGGQTVMQSLYKSECDKAENFVDYMTGPSKMASGEKGVAASSSEDGDEDDLELKMDQERMNLFNSILTEIMFRQRIDIMDVEDMMGKLNTHNKSSKPFTVLEIKPYLQKLHDDSRIFLVEDEGKMGVIYAI